jgi:hypothetical protein
MGLFFGRVIAIQPYFHPRKGPFWQVDLTSKGSRTRVLVEKEFPLGTRIRGDIVHVDDVGTFLEVAEEIPPSSGK